MHCPVIVWLEARLEAIALIEHPLQGVLELSGGSRRHRHWLGEHVRRIVGFQCKVIIIENIRILEEVKVARVQFRRYGKPRIRAGTTFLVLKTVIHSQVILKSMGRLWCNYCRLL